MAETRPRRCKRSPAWNRQERRQHVEDQAASGLSVQDYCFAHGLSVNAFQGWRGRFAVEPRDLDVAPVESRPLPLPAFAEVVKDCPDPPPAVAEVEIVLRCGHRLRVGPDFHEEALCRLVLLLESLPC